MHVAGRAEAILLFVRRCASRRAGPEGRPRGDIARRPLCAESAHRGRRSSRVGVADTGGLGVVLQGMQNIRGDERKLTDHAWARRDLNPHTRAFSPILCLSTQVGEKSPSWGFHAATVTGAACLVVTPERSECMPFLQRPECLAGDDAGAVSARAAAEADLVAVNVPVGSA